MESFDREITVFINTIQFLGAAKKACPEYLGELRSAEEADEKSQAVFTMFILGGQRVIRANPVRLVSIVRAVAMASEVTLTERELQNVCIGVVDRVGREYMEFIKGWEGDLPGLVDGSTTIH